MNRTRLVLAGAVLASLVFSSPAHAIVDGTLDNNDHPYVGLVAMYDADGNYLYRGTGTLIGPRLLLTAGHITAAPGVRAQVFFQSAIQSPIKGPIHLRAERTRYKGVVTLINLHNSLATGYNLQHTGDNGKGNGSGGTNFGDSGGPVFLPGTNVIVAISSFGLNNQGTGPGFAYRTDILDTQLFIADQMAIQEELALLED